MIVPCQLQSVYDLEGRLPPPSEIYVSPTRVTAHYRLAERVSTEDKRALAEHLGFPYGDAPGLLVASYPQISYTVMDILRDKSDIAPLLDQCRGHQSALWQARHRIYDQAKNYSEGALAAFFVLITTDYPYDWVNRAISTEEYVEQLRLAIVQTPDAFLWREVEGRVWVHPAEVDVWWAERYLSKMWARRLPDERRLFFGENHFRVRGL